jgi:hypothetical protein
MEIRQMNTTRQRATQTKFLRGLSWCHSGRHLPKRGNTTTCHLHHHCVTIEGRDNCRRAESHVPLPLITDGMIGVASYLTTNTIVTGSMVVHVPREEANVTGIDPVGHPMHYDGMFPVPPSLVHHRYHLRLRRGSSQEKNKPQWPTSQSHHKRDDLRNYSQYRWQ